MRIIFDIGGTKMRIASSDDGMIFNEPIIVETPRDFDAGMALIRETVLSLTQGKTVEAAAGGIAGALSRDKKTLLNAPNLQGWAGKRVQEALQLVIGAPTYLENDTAMVGLGEAVVGAGKGAQIVAYITVSTGVGGVRIVGGKIDVSAMGFEPGHQIIDAGHTLCGDCGEDLEGYISGRSMEKRFNKKPYEITDLAFWDNMARLLAYGVNNTIVHWSPDVVVLGGSMMKKIGIQVEDVEKYLKGILHIFPEHPRLVRWELGDLGGLHGSLAYLRNVLGEV